MNADPLAYILSSLRRAADNAYSWSLTPAEAGALIAEVERLREGEERRLQLLDDAGGLENERNAERKRADSLALAYREQQGENDVLRAKLEATQRDCDAARAEADEMRRWAEEAAHAENLNAQDAQKERAAVVAYLDETDVTRNPSILPTCNCGPCTYASEPDVKIIPDDEKRLSIKRFNLPATLYAPCPKCGAERDRRFDGDEYVSYPPIDGRACDVSMFCEPCNHLWTVQIRVRFHVEPVDA
jgi:hypothetical protein